MTKHSRYAIINTMNQLLDQLTDCRWKALDYLDAIAGAIVDVRNGHKRNQ